eukprot:11626163-Karenia_brevis.AAC.1
MKHLKVESWICKSRRLKWQWASKIARMPVQRWAVQALKWDPTVTHRRSGRSIGHPRRRWTDEITET